MLSDELEEGRLTKLVRSRFKRLARAAKRPRPISKVHPRRRPRFGSKWKLRGTSPLFKPMQVKATPISVGNSPPTKVPPRVPPKITGG